MKMIGYRFKTEEEMIASYRPNWRIDCPLTCHLDNDVLGLPLKVEFIEYLRDNMLVGTIDSKPSKYVFVRGATIHEHRSYIFDIKDTKENIRLTKAIIDFKYANKDGHPILMEWIVPYYIDTELATKINIKQKQKLIIKLPAHDT